ncbi:MAG: glycine--tRNA ligase subunit beta [Sphingobium sp.]|nr:glycine--tRNA ligase subunit beta [Sphingobium sp.]MCP5399977.1 glycine--tRNA ligase subunit beta [Sphingomonas sp.]
MTDFLLELRCEEIPARMQAKASEDLARLFTERLAEAGLKAEKLTSYVTPRRLALIAHGLPAATEAVREETKGPATSAPEQALEGFLRKTGLTKDQLEVRDLKGKDTYFAVVEKPGRASADVLAEAIPAIIRAFPWPKSMRWGDASQTTESLRWVRPLQGIVALLGDDVVPMDVDGIASGRETVGHRFHSRGAISIGSAADYAEKLRAAHVIVDQDERKSIIESRAKALAAEAGYELIEDAGLVAENAGLTEWPVPLLGKFDPEFLEVPPEVIQLTLRINQKYFVLRDADGKLAPAFICTANIDAKDGGAAIVAGNGKVLAARLSDARFFWEQDKKTKLEEHAKKLGRITFHEKLGTVADKVERVAKLARWLVDADIVKPEDDTPQAKTQLFNNVYDAAMLAKADLVTEMVGEFPELQGLMGGYYARAEGLSDEVADAIRDHYKPVGQGDEVPTAPVTVAVSLADKLDTILTFFLIDEKPTGSKDPFALRRAALQIIAIILYNNLAFRLRQLEPLSHDYGILVEEWGAAAKARLQAGLLDYDEYVRRYCSHLSNDNDIHDEWRRYKRGFDAELSAIEAFVSKRDKYATQMHLMSDLISFLADRLKVQQKEAGVRHDLIDAVFALGGEDDLVRLLARVKALQSFITTDDGENLLAGYKRAANILKKEGFDEAAPSSMPPGSGGAAEVGEEDPGAALTDPDVAEAIREHEANAPLSYAPEPAEADLIAALDAAEPKAQAAVEAEDFEAAMAALASLRVPIDAFFDSVTVNDPEPAKRSARLQLLQRVRAAVHKVADFSKITG